MRLTCLLIALSFTAMASHAAPPAIDPPAPAKTFGIDDPDPDSCNVNDLLAFSSKAIHDLYATPGDDNATLRSALSGDTAEKGISNAQVLTMDLKTISIQRRVNEVYVTFQAEGTITPAGKPSKPAKWTITCQVLAIEFSDQKGNQGEVAYSPGPKITLYLFRQIP